MSEKAFNWFPVGKQVVVQGLLKPEVKNAKVQKPKYDMIEDYDYFVMRKGDAVPDYLGEGDKIWTNHYNLEPIDGFGGKSEEVIYCVLDFGLIRLHEPGAYPLS